MTRKQRCGRWLKARLGITDFLLTLLRVELHARDVRFRNACLPWRWGPIRAARHAQGALVNVACGPFPLPDFLNVDLYRLAPGVIEWDCRWSLPLGDGAAAGIRAEHFFEHLERREEVPAFLADCRRALRPGGVLRIVVPDAGRYAEAYAKGPNDLSGYLELAVPQPFPEDLPTRMDVVNHTFHQWHEHRWGYDAESLCRALTEAGFIEVQPSRFRESALPALAQDRDEHRPYSLYVEGRRAG